MLIRNTSRSGASFYSSLLRSAWIPTKHSSATLSVAAEQSQSWLGTQNRIIPARPMIKSWSHRRNVVYLYQCKRRGFAPNISPFCYKLETWLRAHRIDHELRTSWQFRTLNMLKPFVELNGERIFGSQLIIEKLQEHFGIEDAIDKCDGAMAHAIDRMVERNIFFLLLKGNLLDNLPKTMKAVEPWLIRRCVFYPMMLSFRTRIRRTLKDLELDHYTSEDFKHFLRKDVATLDTVLGDKKFLFGPKPSVADFAVFAHLATSYYMPFDQPITAILDDEFPRVKRLIERMRRHYYPEWKFDT